MCDTPSDPDILRARRGNGIYHVSSQLTDGLSQEPNLDGCTWWCDKKLKGSRPAHFVDLVDKQSSKPL